MEVAVLRQEADRWRPPHGLAERHDIAPHARRARNDRSGRPRSPFRSSTPLPTVCQTPCLRRSPRYGASAPALFRAPHGTTPHIQLDLRAGCIEKQQNPRPTTPVDQTRQAHRSRCAAPIAQGMQPTCAAWRPTYARRRAGPERHKSSRRRIDPAIRRQHPRLIRRVDNESASRGVPWNSRPWRTHANKSPQLARLSFRSIARAPQQADSIR